MKHDARSMLSLGNMYFANSLNLVGEKKQTALKDSYKFFYHVLNNDKSNAYAATGLGMVCSEKDETVLAREIFAKVFDFRIPF